MEGNIVGKWVCRSHGMYVTCEFFNDDTYTYYNHQTGQSNKARYSVSGNKVMPLNNNWIFTMTGDSMKLNQGPGFIFDRA
jgi:hypothetical protein